MHGVLPEGKCGCEVSMGLLGALGTGLQRIPGHTASVCGDWAYLRECSLVVLRMAVSLAPVTLSRNRLTTIQRLCAQCESSSFLSALWAGGDDAKESFSTLSMARLVRADLASHPWPTSGLQDRADRSHQLL